MEINNAVVDMAYAIRNEVRPHIGKQSAKQIIGKTSSGDEEFAIDDIAEDSIERFIRKYDLPVAYYTEGRGLVKTSRNDYLLVIDPIDGTRPAMHGLEGGVISIALAPYSDDACLSDVSFGCVLELKVNRLYTAEKGGTVCVCEDDMPLRVELTHTTDIDKMSWSYEHAGRPAEFTTKVIAPLIDESSIRGGVFVINGTAFSLTRMITGQLDAVVDVSNRILQDYPQLHDHFIKAGIGTVMGLFPYDIAAAVLIAETAGCCVTDAYGNSLGSVALLDTSEENISTCIAASNPILHQKLLARIDNQICDLSYAF
ncbi:MAG: inositol monophosphatase family protein [Armatimonadota bacterium]